MKTCTRCKDTKALEEFPLDKSRKDGHYPSCKPCTRAAKRISNAKNPTSPETRRHYVQTYKNKHPERVALSDRRIKLMSKFGLTLEDYDTLVATQDNLCAICHKPETAQTPRGNIKPLAVDHCHRTNVVRGLLCHRCNTAIGLLDDSNEHLLSAINYLAGSIADSN
jgi:hypothetical protein